jgi:purine-cytosine permease-like protein
MGLTNKYIFGDAWYNMYSSTFEFSQTAIAPQIAIWKAKVTLPGIQIVNKKVIKLWPQYLMTISFTMLVITVISMWFWMTISDYLQDRREQAAREKYQEKQNNLWNSLYNT